MNVDSLERIVPDTLEAGHATGDETYRLHVERYIFAARHITHGRVLDMACGVGYGTHILAEQCGDRVGIVRGVDLSAEAVAYAKQRYAHPKIEFVCADATRFEDAEQFDFIVSLETIEHVPQPEKFIAHLRALLKPGGMVIGSVPTTPSVDANPHHLTDFTEKSYRRMFTQIGFTEVDSLKQIQPFSPLGILTHREKRTQDLRPNILGYYLTHPGSLFRRLQTTLIDGFANHYLTIAWKLG